MLENFTEVLNWSVWLCGAAVVVVALLVVVVVGVFGVVVVDVFGVVVVVVVAFGFASNSLGRIVVVDDDVD